MVDPGFAALPDAVTREQAALVDLLSLSITDGVSREVAVLTDMGAIADAVSRELSALHDKPTPVLLRMMTVSSSPAGIEVRWKFHGSLAVRSSVLERAGAANGAFQKAAVTLGEESDGLTAMDSAVVEGQTYWYRLVVRTGDEQTLIFGPMSVTAAVQVADLALAPIAPNPATGAVQVDFSLPHEMDVRISVLDILGREVAILVDQLYRAGRYSGTWNLTTNHGRAAAGVYFIRLRAGGKSLSRSLVVKP